MRIALTAALLPAVLAASVAGQLYNSTYIDLPSAPCTRLLHATGTIGCQAPTAGVTGVLVSAKTQPELDKFINTAPLQLHAVLLPLSLFTKDNVEKLDKSSKMSGIVVVIPAANDTTTRTATLFSPDSTCPNCEFGLYPPTPASKPYAWNPKGTGLMFEQYSFPIYAVADSPSSLKLALSTLQKAAEANMANGLDKYPLRAVEFNAFMWAALDSATCLRRSWCQPIGGLSIISTPSASIRADDSKPILVVSASLSARSMFRDLTVGVSTSVGSTVALLATIDAISRVNATLSALPTHILYTFFAGEDWGMVGSSRFIHDLVADAADFKCQTNFKEPVPGCPYTKAACAFPCRRDLDYRRIAFPNIRNVIEIGSVAGHSGTPPLNSSSVFSAHVHERTAATEALATTLGATIASDVAAGRQLPAGSSAQSFIAARKSDHNMAAVVIADYRDSFGNEYNSELDDTYTNATTQSVCQAAQQTAQAALSIAASGASITVGQPTVNCSLVEELMYCLSANYSCPLVAKYLQPDPASNASPATVTGGLDRISHYSIFQYGQTHPIAQFVYRFAFDLTAATRGKPCNSTAICDLGEACLFGKCAAGFTRFHDAYGTGLELQATGLFKVVDQAKPVWTESTWDPVGFRVFRVSSTIADGIQLLVGLIFGASTFGIVYISRRFLSKTLKVY